MKKMKITNLQMENMIHELDPFLKYKGILGYSVARNVRILSVELTEYYKFKDELIKKYGEETPQEEWSSPFPEYRVSVSSPNFDKFIKELTPYSNIEHEVDIMTCYYREVIDQLSGEELLAIDWMLVEEGDTQDG